MTLSLSLFEKRELTLSLSTRLRVRLPLRLLHLQVIIQCAVDVLLLLERPTLALRVPLFLLRHFPTNESEILLRHFPTNESETIF